ncbi:MAG: 4'-phosphopantetheinyl transferase superfamily protein [Actinomycetia bacterium]|nr:4'-phosphopantetheinyl transferase superfamily protein [Actinomycetes bacterium]MCP4085327.1 4'-phosphopantetheinyl transferase superfamily protein [Actinomycetes bacterium]
MSSVLNDILTTGVGVETRNTEADDSLLWPAERDSLGDVVEGRFRSYVLGRRCARLALGQLGVEPQPILTGDQRQPLWPSGVVGSITHTAGYVAAAVARLGDLRSMGIDAEPDLPMPPGVVQRISRPEDATWLSSDADFGVTDPGRLLFSAKEAIYKAWFPVAERWLGFRDAFLEIDACAHTFLAHITVDGPLSTLDGRYRVSDGIVICTIELAA